MAESSSSSSSAAVPPPEAHHIQTNRRSEEYDPESNSQQQPLLHRSPTLTASQYAMVGAKVSRIESLDYEFVNLSDRPPY